MVVCVLRRRKAHFYLDRIAVHIVLVLETLTFFELDNYTNRYHATILPTVAMRVQRVVPRTGIPPTTLVF